MAIVRWEPFRGMERWEPFREMESLRRDMDRLFDQLMPSGPGGNGEKLRFMPSAEIEDTADEIHLKLEIPGLEAKDLDIEVTEESVTVRGERKSEARMEEKGMMRSEFRYGRFERLIPLTARVKSDAAKAEYKNGILTLTLPKAEEEKSKVVKVTVN